MTIPLVATYRVQLRGGLDFDALAARLAHVRKLGASHLYLSPIFTATEGSTHGYDVTDPTAIDPALGGEAGFRRLAFAAQAEGLGLILDIVPNHTALSIQNPWMRDVLRLGADSPVAGHFDIDWSQPLALPFLELPLEEMLAAGRLTLTARDGGAVEWDGDWLPLRPGTLPDTGRDDADAIRQVLAAQPWRLRHWQRERDSLTHRRFFNITTLIGMRIERPEVFDAMMALPLRLVDEGLVQGLRLDHIDGLADPAGFLDRLRARVGAKVPIWVEKILTGDEALPDWPVEGTTGYEAAAAATAVLTSPKGVAALDSMWREVTGDAEDYPATCRATRAQVLSEELATELLRLIDAAGAAFTAAGATSAPGPEALREAVVAFLCAFPRYRSYAWPDALSDDDRRVLDETLARGGGMLRDDAVLARLVAMIGTPDTPEAARLQRIAQQTTGGLVAKSEEDCAFFRYTLLLSACEVGADPAAPSMDAAAFQRFAARQPPLGLIAGSTHDTKRSEDARCRLVALTLRPELMQALWDGPEARCIAPGHRWYLLQSALAMWQPDCPDAPDRLADHMLKALREERRVTVWAFPDEDAEAPVLQAARDLASGWQAQPPAAVDEAARIGAALSLDHLALRMMLPGVPDIYQDSETGSFRLTDPDNRAPWSAGSKEPDALGRAKTELIRRFLDLRRRLPRLFAAALSCTGEDGSLTLVRQDGDKRLTVRLSAAADGEPPRLELDE